MTGYSAKGRPKQGSPSSSFNYNNNSTHNHGKKSPQNLWRKANNKIAVKTAFSSGATSSSGGGGGGGAGWSQGKQRRGSMGTGVGGPGHGGNGGAASFSAGAGGGTGGGGGGGSGPGGNAGGGPHGNGSNVNASGGGGGGNSASGYSNSNNNNQQTSSFEKQSEVPVTLPGSDEVVILRLKYEFEAMSFSLLAQDSPFNESEEGQTVKKRPKSALRNSQRPKSGRRPKSAAFKQQHFAVDGDDCSRQRSSRPFSAHYSPHNPRRQSLISGKRRPERPKSAIARLNERNSCPVERFYQGGGKLFTFLPDGSGTVFYPSGRIAISIVCEKRGKSSFAYHDDQKQSMLASFAPAGTGSCWDVAGTERFLCTGKTAFLKDEGGKVAKTWAWSQHLVKPVVIELNSIISLLVESKARIFLRLKHGSEELLKFNIRSRLDGPQYFALRDIERRQVREAWRENDLSLSPQLSLDQPTSPPPLMQEPTGSTSGLDSDESIYSSSDDDEDFEFVPHLRAMSSKVRRLVENACGHNAAVVNSVLGGKKMSNSLRFQESRSFDVGRPFSAPAASVKSKRRPSLASSSSVNVGIGGPLLQPPFRGGLAKPKPVYTTMSTNDATGVTSTVATDIQKERESHILCICVAITEVPFVDDAILDQLFRKKQLLVIFVTSSLFPNENIETELNELQGEQLKGRKEKCSYLNSVAPHRFLKYSCDNIQQGTKVIVPNLVSRHKVNNGTFMFFYGGELVFLGKRLNGYGTEKEDIAQQILLCTKKAEAKEFLPADFEVQERSGALDSPTRCLSPTAMGNHSMSQLLPWDYLHSDFKNLKTRETKIFDFQRRMVEIERKLLPAQLEYEQENDKRRKSEDVLKTKKKTLDIFAKAGGGASRASSRKQSTAGVPSDMFGGDGRAGSATKLKNLAGLLKSSLSKPNLARKESKGSVMSRQISNRGPNDSIKE
eukprot:Nk52_evm3s2630 gene=Nk52_evmTU3s2630